MNIAIVMLTGNKLLKKLAADLETKFNQADHTIRTIDGNLAPERLTAFHYVIFCIDSGRLFGSDPRDPLKHCLQSAGTITNKYISIFTNNRPFASKVLEKIMKMFEAEGTKIHFSDVVKSKAEVDYITDLLDPIKPGT